MKSNLHCGVQFSDVISKPFDIFWFWFVQVCNWILILLFRDCCLHTMTVYPPTIPCTSKVGRTPQSLNCFVPIFDLKLFESVALWPFFANRIRNDEASHILQPVVQQLLRKIQELKLYRTRIITLRCNPASSNSGFIATPPAMPECTARHLFQDTLIPVMLPLKA